MKSIWNDERTTFHQLGTKGKTTNEKMKPMKTNDKSMKGSCFPFASHPKTSTHFLFHFFNSRIPLSMMDGFDVCLYIIRCVIVLYCYYLCWYCRCYSSFRFFFTFIRTLHILCWYTHKHTHKVSTCMKLTHGEFMAHQNVTYHDYYYKWYSTIHTITRTHTITNT